jgi:carbon-monoxide dehydrogenase medium subunit
MLTPHPGLPEFDYIKPTTLEEASTFLAQHAGEARAFSGGTDTFVRMRDGAWQDKYLVDVKGLPGMNDLKFDPAKRLTVGAAVNMNRLIASPEVNEHYPVLAEAAHTVASYQLRTRTTITGNICNASPAGDTIGACLVLMRSCTHVSLSAEAARLLHSPQDGFESGDITAVGSCCRRARRAVPQLAKCDRRSGDRGRDGWPS